MLIPRMAASTRRAVAVSASKRTVVYFCAMCHSINMISKSYKFRVYPTESQRNQLDVDFFAARWVYNRGLDMISSAYSERKERLSYVGVSRQLTVFKKREGCAWRRLS